MLILVDTSIWVDHLRKGDETLSRLLDKASVLAHPFVTGEIALGHLRQRDLVLAALQDLPVASVATDPEVLHFITQHSLFGFGIGYIDAHLLAAVKLTLGASLWTRDKRLHSVAEAMGLAWRHDGTTGLSSV
ncbi:MAG: type II toxin-antitoxin system VapC family toxin [Beijerinckiaceae bacterium]